MARSFLYLGINDSGIDARVVKGSGEVAGRSECLWEDLPESGSEHEDIEQAITILARELELGACRSSVVLLPDHWFCFRTLTLPFTSKGKIRQVLNYELLSSLPRDDIDYASGFHCAGACFNPDENLVLTASLPQERIQALIQILTAFNLPPAVISPQTYALCSAAFSGKTGNQAYILVESNAVVLTLASGPDPVYIRFFSGWQAAPENLVKKVKSALSGFCLKFGAEPDFQINIISLLSEKQGAEIERMFRADPGLGIQPRVSEITSLPPADLPIPGALPKGLLNLIDPPFGPAAFIRNHTKGVLSAAGLAAAVFLLFMTGLWMDISDLEARVDEKKADIKSVFLQAFPGKAHIMGPYPLTVLTSLVAQAEKQASGDALIGFDLPGVTQVLAELSARIPNEGQTRITRMNMNKGRLTLAGKTATFNQVDRIKTGLDGSSLFRTVAITNAQADKSGNLVRFTFVLTL